VLVAASPAAIEAARRASARVPIVMVSVDDPAARGWVPDLARPAANLTGVTFALPELPGRRVDWLARLVPGLREVAVLTNPANPSATAEAAELGRAAAGRGLAVTTVGLRPDVRFKDTLGAVERAKPGGLLVATDAVLVAEREAIARFAARQRLPAVYPLAEFVEAGGLAALGGERAEAFRGAARYAARLLDGARPADLPVERVARIELVVNLKAARAARLSVPEAVLRGAARVVP
jgi:putative ABC transport system substrate-binding protein